MPLTLLVMRFRLKANLLAHGKPVKDFRGGRIANGLIQKLPARLGIAAFLLLMAMSAYWLLPSSAATGRSSEPPEDGPGCVVNPTPTYTTYTFSNEAPIVPADRVSNDPGTDPGLPSLYPSVIQVGGAAPESCVLTEVKVTFAVTSQRPDDLDMLLIDHRGSRSILISDAGGSDQLNDVVYTISLNRPTFPDETAPPSGTYSPGQYPGLVGPEPDGFDNFPGVNGLASYPSDWWALFSHSGLAGAWKLYVVDDETGHASGLPTGWTLQFVFMCTTPPMMCTPTPTPSPTPSCQPGVLDPTFGGDGLVTTSIMDGFSVATSMAIQPDGRIVAAGYACAEPGGNCQFYGARLKYALTRYLENGALDSSFGTGGIVTTEFYGIDRANALALQPDGKIVVAGRSVAPGTPAAFALARYNADGSLDASFGTGGKVTTTFPDSIGDGAYSVAIQPDGRIVAGGGTRDAGSLDAFALARYNGDGTLDPSFGTGGLVKLSIDGRESEARAIALQPDGRIVAVGSVIRSPGPDGALFAAARYNSDGTLDTSFGTGGTVTTEIGPLADAALAVAMQTDGRIVAAGIAYVGTTPHSDFALVRYYQDGTLDTTFGTGGKVTTAIAPETGLDSLEAIAIQDDGRIVAAGDSASDISLARYNPDGTLDTSLNGTGLITTNLEPNFSGATSVAIQEDGKIVAAGRGFGGTNYDVAVMRYGAPCSTPTPSPTPTPTPTPSPAASPNTAFDYDGDRKADVSVYRPANRRWYLLQSRDGYRSHALPFGPLKATPADHDGDGKTDLSGYEVNAELGHLVWLSSSPPIDVYSVRFGLADDIPVPADHTGAGRADVVVFRPSNGTWYRWTSEWTFASTQFGMNGDWPTMGDFDGDRRADVAVFRPSDGIWYRLNSSNGSFVTVQFGLSGDKVVPADYDGDGQTDIAIYRPSDGVWHIWRSTLGYYSLQFGLADDIPAPADYDGDGRADITVFRPSSGIWYRLNSSNGTLFAVQWGQNGDIPTPAAYIN